ncbi:MAG: sel1 repeat family protein [Lachnospiraceae bacterium]|nr:sel1 repeat family protein [Lachnospiraceae bacterium]
MDEIADYAEISGKSKGYPVDLSGLEVPVRDKAHAQRAVQETDHAVHLWLWFADESHHNLLEDTDTLRVLHGKETPSYDDFLAAYWFLAVRDPLFARKEAWTAFFACLNRILLLSDTDLFQSFLLPHVKAYMDVHEDFGLMDAVRSFRETIAGPVEESLKDVTDSAQLDNFISVFYAGGEDRSGFGDTIDAQLGSRISEWLERELSVFYRMKQPFMENDDRRYTEEEANAFLEEAERFIREGMPAVNRLRDAMRDRGALSEMMAAKVFDAIGPWGIGYIRWMDGFMERSGACLFQIIDCVPDEKMDDYVYFYFNRSFCPRLRKEPLLRLKKSARQQILKIYAETGSDIPILPEEEVAFDDDVLYQSALSMDDAHQFAEAFSCFKRLADRQHIRAMHRCYEYYIYGYGTEKNPGEASRLVAQVCQKLADRDCSEDETRDIRRLLLYADACKNPEAEMYLYRFFDVKAADYACDKAGYKHRMSGLREANEQDLALYCALKTAWGAYEPAIFDVGYMYYQGKGTDKCYRRAEECFLQVIEKSNEDLTGDFASRAGDAYFLLSSYYNSGIGRPVDRKKGMEYVREAVRRNCYSAKNWAKERNISLLSINGYESYDNQATRLLTHPDMTVIYSGMFLTPDNRIGMRLHVVNKTKKDREISVFDIHAGGDTVAQNVVYTVSPMKVMSVPVVLELAPDPDRNQDILFRTEIASGRDRRRKVLAQSPLAMVSVDNRQAKIEVSLKAGQG